jgi:hypothetical protein
MPSFCTSKEESAIAPNDAPTALMYIEYESR